MTGFAFVLAFYLRVGNEILAGEHTDALLQVVPVLVGLAMVIYFAMGLYRGIWRYASTPDLINLVRAVTVVTVAFVVTVFLLWRLEGIPRSVPVIQWFVLLALLGGPRFAYRIYKDRRLQASETAGEPGHIRVLLVGAGDGADLFLRSLAKDKNTPYRTVGIVDLKRGRVGRQIRGVQVLGDVRNLAQIVGQLRERGQTPARLVLTVAPHELGGPAIRRMFDEADLLGLSLARLPRLTDLRQTDEDQPIELSPIAVEDLLGRPQVALDRGAITGLVKGRRVLITGAGGTIGSELSRQVAALEPEELILLDFGEHNLYAIDLEIAESFPALGRRAILADVRWRERLVQVFRETRPEIVFHAAALKHVPMVELNPAEGALTNAVGTRNVAHAARAVGVAAMVLISTDKAVRPANVMGATKRIAEAYCQALDLQIQREGGDGPRFLTVRFGNVLGSSGSVVPLFQRQLAKGQPLTVTHPEVRRYFMTVREAVELVLQASAHGLLREAARGRVFVLDMGDPVRILDLARQMIRLAGLRPEVDVEIKFIGLRPGEKLYEEVLSDAEAPTRTEADGVLMAAPRPIDYAIIGRAVSELENAARAGDLDKLQAILRNLVPDYATMSSEMAAVARAMETGPTADVGAE